MSMAAVHGQGDSAAEAVDFASSPPLSAAAASLPPPSSVLLITQNVGTFDASESKTVTEALRQHVHSWTASVAAFIKEHERRNGGAPLDLVVLHMQEIGGKKFHAALNEFLAAAVPSCYPGAAWCSGLLMPNTNDDTTFTAMGAIIWLSARLAPLASVLSVRHRTYLATSDNPRAQAGMSALFHGGKFCNAEKSRKGFLATSLRVGGQILNFVNLHLYHDADNAAAVRTSPSEYVARRQEALVEAITEVSPLVSPDDPLFIFGDLNMRLDGKGLLEFLQRRFDASIEMGKKEVRAPKPILEYLNSPLLHLDELLAFDLEGPAAMREVAAATGVQLAELPRVFPPTYLYTEGPPGAVGGGAASTPPASGPGTPSNVSVEKSPPAVPGIVAAPPTGRVTRPYKLERFPGWCDRVLFNPAAAVLMATQATCPPGHLATAAAVSPSAVYDSACLESLDHEAVYLFFSTSLL